MVAALQRDELLLLPAAGHVEVVDDEADRGIDRVGSAEGEIDVAQRLRRDLHELRGEADGRLRAEVEVARRVGKLAHLLGGHAHHALVAVADVHAPQARERVEQLAPVDVAQVGSVAGVEDGHPAALVRAEFGNRMDQVLAVEVDEGFRLHGEGEVWAVPILSSAPRGEIAIWAMQMERRLRFAPPTRISCCGPRVART